MIQIEANVEEFQWQLTAAMQEVEQYVSREYYRWTLRIFQDLVLSTPQWSGDTAANWKYSVGGPSGDYTQLPAKALRWPFNQQNPPVERGDYGAWFAAKVQFDSITPPTYKDAVYFTNNAPVAPYLEQGILPADDGVRPIRAVNLLGSQVMMSSFIAAKWRNIPA